MNHKSAVAEVSNIAAGIVDTLGATQSIEKSFTTGYEIGADNRQGGNAVRREFLDNEINVLTYGMDDFTIYTAIDRKKSASPIAQYVIQDGYGETGNRAAIGEIGAAAINNTKLAQKTVKMRFLSDTRQVSWAAAAANNVADPMQLEKQSSIITLAKTIEYFIFFGDEDLVANGDATGRGQFDGLDKLIDHRNVFDVRGKELDEISLNQAAVAIGKGFGRPTDAFMPIGVHAGFINNQLNRQRIIQGTDVNSAGVLLTKFQSARGAINLHGSTIMDSEDILDASAIVAHNAPAAPNQVIATVKDGAGRFSAEDVAKGAEYKVRLVGSTGAGYTTDATAAVTAKSEVTLAVEISAISAVQPDYVEVFRKSTEGQNEEFYLVARVSLKDVEYKNGIGTLTIVDKNDKMPGTSTVFVAEMSPRVIALFEFMPMMRQELPSMVSANSFMTYWSGALGLFAPRKAAKIVNVASVM